MIKVDTLTPMRLGATQDDLEILSSNPLLGQLAPRELGMFLELLGQLAVTSGTELMREGDEGDFMYFILEGVAVVSRAKQVIRRLGPAQHVGELAMLGVRQRDVTVVAETIMRLARLSRPRYQSLAARHPGAALHLLQALVGSLGEDVAQLTDSVAALVGRRSNTRPLQIRVRTAFGDRHVASGTPIEALVPEQIDGHPIVAALLDSKPVMLETPVVSDARVDAVSLPEMIGRDAFRQSVGLLLLEAARSVAPHLPIRLGHAVDDLRVIEIGDEVIDRLELGRRLGLEMRRLVDKDVEFHSDVWTVEEARAQLNRQGWTDAALLLRTARSPVTTLQTCGQVHSLVVGPMVPSARHLRGFTLAPHPEGLVLDFGPLVRPSVSDPQHAAALARELSHPRFGAPMVRAHRSLLRTMGVHSVGDFNELCVRGEIERVIRVAEGFHEKQIGWRRPRARDQQAAVSTPVGVAACARVRGRHHGLPEVRAVSRARGLGRVAGVRARSPRRSTRRHPTLVRNARAGCLSGGVVRASCPCPSRAASLALDQLAVRMS